MVRKGKLDLMNNRLGLPRQSCPVYDSSLDAPMLETTSQLKSQHYDLDKTISRDQLLSPKIYHTNEIVDAPKYTHRGHKVTLKQSIEDSKMRSYLRPRRSNDYELIFNKTAQVYKTAPKFDSCVSIKRNELADQTISAKVKYGRVNGVQFGTTTTNRPPLHVSPTKLGPGDYDVTAWERYELSPKAVKFDGPEGDRSTLKYSDGPSPITYSPVRPSTTGSIKFNKADRFTDDMASAYKRGTGLTLSPNYDASDSWKSRANYEMKKQLNARNKLPILSDHGVDFVNTDSGKKMTLKTEVERSNYHYAPCFKSKSQVGLEVPSPASGTVGPDEYEGKYKSTLRCTDPNNASSCFGLKREIDIIPLGQQYKTLKPRFGKVLSEVKSTRNQSLNATVGEKKLNEGLYTTFGRGRKGRLKKSKFSNKLEYDYTPEVKLSHVAEWSKSKMTKIYPTLAKKKYGETMYVDS